MAKKTLMHERDRREIVERVRKIQPSAKRQWGRMSVHGMLCHLSDAFRGATSLRPMTRGKSPGPRWLVKWIAFDLPFPWPKGVETRPESDQLIGGTPPADFETDRMGLLALLDRFTRNPKDFEWPEHPIFGNMTDAEWMRWGYLHVDHHLRQFGG